MFRHTFSLAAAATALMAGSPSARLDAGLPGFVLATPKVRTRRVQKYNARSKYMPHQGKRECARRVRQMNGVSA